MSTEDKPLVWLHGEIKTPPFSPAARIEAGVLLRRLQRGEQLSIPHSRPMPSIGPWCHELRINDADAMWRIIYEEFLQLSPEESAYAELRLRLSDGLRKRR